MRFLEPWEWRILMKALLVKCQVHHHDSNSAQDGRQKENGLKLLRGGKTMVTEFEREEKTLARKTGY
jgi:hypothetical protein